MPEEYVIIRDWGLEEEEDEGLLSPVSKSPLEALANLEAEHVSLDEGDLEEVSRERSVIGIAPNMPLKLIEPVATEGDEEIIEAEAVTNTWGIEAVRAHESQFDGSGIKVAVLDTGIDLNHPAFAGMNIKYKNFTNGSDDDVNGHGTHCAGTIFGQDVSGKRIGVARGIDEAIVGKVLGPGGGQSNQLVDAMIWAAKNGAHIISMSLGIDFTGMVDKRVARGIKRPAAISMSLEGYSANVQLFSTLIDMMENRFRNVLVVAASGNDSERPSYKIAVSPPAAGKGILSVGALRKTGGRLAVASFSNDNVDLSAPGKSIESARSGGGLKKLNGTSMATPHVAGVAALWAQKEKEEIGEDPDKSTLVAMLRANATRDNFVNDSSIRDIGGGIVQAPID